LMLKGLVSVALPMVQLLEGLNVKRYSSDHVLD